MMVGAVKFKIHRANQQIGNSCKLVLQSCLKFTGLETQGFYVAFLRPNSFSVNPFFALRLIYIMGRSLFRI